MLIDIAELQRLSDKKETSDASRTLYYQKISSILFAAITIEIDIAFEVSRLS